MGACGVLSNAVVVCCYELELQILAEELTQLLCCFPHSIL